MIDLMKADFFKARNSSVLFVLFFFACFSSGFMFVSAHIVAEDIGRSSILQFASFFSDAQMISLLGCIFVGTYLCRDFNEKAIEQAIGSGKKRGQIIANKILILILFVFLLYLPYVAGSIFLGASSISAMAFVQTIPLKFAAENNSLDLNAETLLNIGKLFFLSTFTMASQLSITIPFVFVLRRSVSVLASSYLLLLLLGPVASLNSTVKDVLSFTPFYMNADKMVLGLPNEFFFKRVLINSCFILLIAGVSWLIFRKSEI
ncbi:hypothetical protein P7E02_16740 [Enterococcus hulanensis]|uniref:hypothetical protein n=1 Tax=Enterococcus hulanensis TaxID=2559929 RepID=UPI00288DEC4F|nr:hypothetical protein [Enterococcus hulanensis]MDT2661524.1 hypothetical protein [Enterococcus hulanensis]